MQSQRESFVETTVSKFIVELHVVQESFFIAQAVVKLKMVMNFGLLVCMPLQVGAR
jgi:hypothetical protein